MSRVHLAVGDTTLRFAITYVLEQHGYRRARDLASAALVISDIHELSRLGRGADALVVDPSPAACQSALDAVTDGRARSVICSDALTDLPAALAAAVAGTTNLPTRLIVEANRVPRLPGRLHRTLRLVLSGYTNEAIARQLHESQSTTKRNVAELLHLFGVPNRTALNAAARLAGFT